MQYTIVPVTHYQQNCSILVCEQTGKAAIVDPGGDLPLIIDALDQINATPEVILVTHGHMDHIGGVKALSDQLNLPIYGPQQEDQFWIQALEEQCRLFDFPVSEPFEPNLWLNEGDTIRFGKTELQVIHCPGHTPGHVVFYQPEAKLAIVGDVLFNGSIGRTDFPKGNHQDLIHSIQQKLFPLGEEVRFIPGHGPMSTFGQEMHHNPFVAIYQGKY
jgi:glyoxylase-like metal-dependent hydrolase (beta-lactamase superfamily II)